VETPKDFFGGIISFFGRYGRHFLSGFKYFWTPSLKVAPFENKDFKEDSQRTFELALIVTAFLIFMIKMDWVPVNEDLKNVYSNDIFQMFMEFMIFLIFGMAYLFLVFFSVMIGRMFRFFFRFSTTRNETDILFSYLNNSLFSITVIIAFMFRCGIQWEQVKSDDFFIYNVLFLYLVLFIPVLAIWSVRFSNMNGVKGFRRMIFVPVSTLFFSLFFSIASQQITFFIMGT
jgi:hypothetical protein